MARVHRDVEFEVHHGNGKTDRYGDFEGAAARALDLALAHGKSVIDVIVWSQAGARAYGGSDGVASYKEDPEASVFERIELKVNLVGRVA